MVVDDVNVGGLFHAVDQGARGAEGVPPVDDDDAPGKAGKVERVLRRGVSAAGDDHVPAAVERAVAGRAVGDAAAAQAVLVRQAERPGRGAHAQDDAVRRKLLARGKDALGLPGQLHALDLVVADVQAEALRLLGHVHAQLRPADALGKAGVVLDDVGGGGLAAAELPLEQRAAQPRAQQVQPRGQARRAAADDDGIQHGSLRSLPARLRREIFVLLLFYLRMGQKKTRGGKFFRRGCLFSGKCAHCQAEKSAAPRARSTS